MVEYHLLILPAGAIAPLAPGVPIRGILRGPSAMNRLLLGFLIGSLAARVDAGDWPQFLGPTRNGVAEETGLATSWSADGPRVLWQRRVGHGWSGPVIAGDRLVLFH